MDKFILAPGPTQCKEELLKVLSEPVMYHRSSDFRKMYQQTRENLENMMGFNFFGNGGNGGFGSQFF